MSRGAALLLAAVLSAPTLAAPAGLTGLDGRADAIVDLRTAEGARAAGAVWKYADAAIVPVDFRAPGPDLKPTGAKTKTFDLTPRAGAADYDDAAWVTLDPTTLEGRRTSGKLAFGWYRLHLTIPSRVGSLDTTGTTAVLEIVVDDYAEISIGRRPSSAWRRLPGFRSTRQCSSRPPGSGPIRPRSSSRRRVTTTSCRRACGARCSEPAEGRCR